MTEKVGIKNDKVEIPHLIKGAPRHSQKWVIGVVVGVVVLYAVIVIGGLWYFHALGHTRSGNVIGMNGRPSGSRHMVGGYGGMYGQQMFTQTTTSSDGLTSTATTTTYTQTQGVVTAVSGDTITVAGGGKTQIIKTNGSTTYNGDTKPVINDTVIIVGAKDGDTITATDIAVNN